MDHRLSASSKFTFFRRGVFFRIQITAKIPHAKKQGSLRKHYAICTNHTIRLIENLYILAVVLVDHVSPESFTVEDSACSVV